ncbi:MAG: ABC transporter permease, partial [Saprospiraceae bacterium]|nr:ABC transporter permease [Saprospiraceae bacterium]
PSVQTLVPRIESFALAAYGHFTKGVLVVGTVPEREESMTQLSEKIVSGNYLEENEAAVLIAEGIASKMKIAVGDTLVLISQGYHGVNAAGKYPVKGIVKFGSPELNKQLVYLPLKAAQYFYGAENLVTTVALDIDQRDEVQATVGTLKSQLPAEDFEVMMWQDMMPELVEARELDTAGNYIILLILYVIIAFGIFGTILMMTKERQYEFGVLIAIGMSRWKLFFTVWIEIIFLGFLGALAGILASLPIVYYFYLNPLDFSQMSEGLSSAYEKFGFEPIFPASMDWEIFFNQALFVFLITSLMALYPFFKIMNLQPIQAMRG